MSILAFHSIAPGFHPGITNFKPERFRKLLCFLIDSGFNIVPLSDYLKERKKSDITLTFDDGYADFYHHAFPILQTLGISASVFIPTRYIGKKADWDFFGKFSRLYHLSANAIMELSGNGIEFGSHGLSHFAFTQLNDRQLKIELADSKKEIEDLTGKRCKYLCYPFGLFNNLVEDRASEAGYERGFSLGKTRAIQDGFSLPRFGVYAIDTSFSIKRKCQNCLIEKIKGRIINSFSYGTVFLDRFKKYPLEIH